MGHVVQLSSFACKLSKKNSFLVSVASLCLEISLESYENWTRIASPVEQHGCFLSRGIAFLVEAKRWHLYWMSELARNVCFSRYPFEYLTNRHVFDASEVLLLRVLHCRFSRSKQYLESLSREGIYRRGMSSDKNWWIRQQRPFSRCWRLVWSLMKTEPGSRAQ